MGKIYANQTLEEFLSRATILTNGCWISPTSTTVRVKYNGEPLYLIRAIFDAFNLNYNGRIVRSCKNNKCINPKHLWSPTKEEKFWSSVYVGDSNECWEWKSLSGTVEYADTSFNGISEHAHRIAYRITFGDILEGMCVCHHCDNPPCCNPNHLFLGTHQDNIDDRERKNRNKLPYSKGENHGIAKLSEREIVEIRNLYINGDYSYRKLADMFGVSFGNIRKIIKKETWAWLE